MTMYSRVACVACVADHPDCLSYRAIPATQARRGTFRCDAGCDARKPINAGCDASDARKQTRSYRRRNAMKSTVLIACHRCGHERDLDRAEILTGSSLMAANHDDSEPEAA